MMEAGSTIDGRYCLVSLIGEGGMASVWRAEDQNLKRAVAIKLLYLGPQRDPSLAVEQFLREARIAAAVQHRNVIHTMDFGTTADGVPYMVMELLHGETLAQRMQRAPALRVDEWIRIAEMTLRGLAAVHDAGIVHRDLKPQNIFLQRDADGVYPKILDFGISRSSGAQQLESPIATQRGFVIGTPHYMAPEQASGEGRVDHRADLYSVGTILYEGLSGRLPFDAQTTSDLLLKIISSEPTPLKELCPKKIELIAECVAQAMSRNPDERFADARAFRTALTRAYELTFPASQNNARSELPLSPVALAAAPQNDVRNAWGDFEGLPERSSARDARDAGLPLAAAGNPPGRPASGPLGVAARPASGPLGAAPRRQSTAALEAAARRDPSGSLGGAAARPASGALDAASARQRNDPSGSIGAAARRQSTASLGAAARRDPSGSLGAAARPASGALDAASARERNDASAPLGAAGRRDPNALDAAARRDPSGPLGAASARDRRDAGALGAAGRRDASVPLDAAGRRQSSASLGAAARREPSGPLGAASARERKDLSVPLGAAGRRDPSGPLAGASAREPGPGEPPPRARTLSDPHQEAVRAPVPDAAISYPGEGPLLGDNPLDAFSGAAAVALELDFAPWQERQADDPELKEKKPVPVQQASAASPQREAPAAAPAPARAAPRVHKPSSDAGLWWLLPVAILLLFGVFLLFPNLISLAPPDDAAARAREAESAATRGSSRVLQRQRAEVSPTARPELRELVE